MLDHFTALMFLIVAAVCVAGVLHPVFDDTFIQRCLLACLCLSCLGAAWGILAGKMLDGAIECLGFSMALYALETARKLIARERQK